MRIINVISIFASGHGVSLFSGFQHSPVEKSTASCDPGVLTGGTHTSSTLPPWFPFLTYKKPVADNIGTALLNVFGGTYKWYTSFTEQVFTKFTIFLSNF